MMGCKAQTCGPLPPLTLAWLVPANHVYRHLERALGCRPSPVVRQVSHDTC